MILSILGWHAEKPHVQYFSIASLWAVIYLGPFAGIFGILCYFTLQQKVGVFKASIAFLIFPLIALSFENLVCGHTLSNRSMICVVPLIFGILLTLIPKKHLKIH
ncbi:DMT family transporter [Candidatus Williamhamiltonella defendens]|uniref:DMT family transporter n=1 Tax=Candidatus Williamhamiltonella defendens TaxID=138072 RepID=UPI001F172473|nr:DMT family transporter [Candidatus Hamiltonella defensa]